ncbi:MAG: hypothetical protein BGO21_07835 [Dyadobacter sp. 50-39]|uniref:AraC family transcriptional regulator n=1 Tax=Dyadobacter sp. 50-39 TaxID=1895756 RepID=UPI000969ECA9|nr:helix-turn-helix domain-containing protein [Dyadobacter sp. 50-39]OJV20484.1 MAG: hypothetical protein BGO21_07835 [Dyadobacter sp. 50-39]
MKNFPSTAVHPLSVQTIRAGRGADDNCDAYRAFWLKANPATSFRKLLIHPPGSLPTPHSLHDMYGHVISFPEEFLLMFGFAESFPFRVKAALPRSQSITIDLSGCPFGRTIERTIDNMKDQCSRLPNGHLSFSGNLKVMLVSVTRIFQHHDEAPVICADRQLFERFIQLVAQENAAKKGMQDYAKALSIRADVLSDAVKRISGYPASHHIYQHIIRTAKHAAIGSGATMKEVAYGLGFKDVTHFSKFFRNKAGMTFTDYKKAYQLL